MLNFKDLQSTMLLLLFRDVCRPMLKLRVSLVFTIFPLHIP